MNSGTLILYTTTFYRQDDTRLLYIKLDWVLSRRHWLLASTRARCVTLLKDRLIQTKRRGRPLDSALDTVKLRTRREEFEGVGRVRLKERTDPVFRQWRVWERRWPQGEQRCRRG